MMQQLPLNIELRHEASFDSFVAEDEAVAVALYQVQMAIIRKQGGVWYFWGAPGSGKTHLLQAACRFSAQWERQCVYLNLRDDEIASFPDLLRGLEQLDAVCLDELEAVIGEASWQQALADLLMHAQNLGHVVLMTGAQPLSELPIELEALNRQLMSVVPVPLKPLCDRETMLLAIQRHGAVRGLQVPKSVAKYLLKVFEERLEDALMALHRIEQVSLIEKRRITLPFVKKVIDHV